MLKEDFIDGWLDVYKKPKIEKTLWQKIVYAIKKPLYDNITFPMRLRLINLTCFIKGHDFKLMFKPDLRKNRNPEFDFLCERCLTHVGLTIKK